MFRLVFAIAIIAFIFVHSPQRPATGLSEDAGRWAGWTQREITEAALRSGTAQAMLRNVAAAEERPALRGMH